VVAVRANMPMAGDARPGQAHLGRQ
jgi:hypothetical protein